MNKRNLCLFLYLLVPLFFIIPPVLAAPTAQVTYPNGGEILSGTETITWNASSSENSQDLNVILSYSFTAGEEHFEITDTNLLPLCEFGEANFWIETDANIDSLFGLARNVSSRDSSLVFYAGQWHLILTGDLSDTNAATYNPTTESWDANSDLSQGITGFKISDYFELDGYLYGLGEAGGVSKLLKGVKWNPATKVWVEDTEIIEGLPAKDEWAHQNHNFVITDHFPSYDWLIVMASDYGDTTNFPSSVKSYFWAGASVGWIRDDTISTDFNINVPDPAELDWQGSDVFVKDGVLYGLLHEKRGITVGGIIRGIRYDSINSKWVVDSDINKDLGTPYHVNVSTFKDGSTYTALLTYMVADVQTHTVSKDFGVGFRTDVNQTCSYSWDTTAVNSGQYYIDVNIYDYDNNLMILDSSDGKFSIINWTDSDITCECISNCSSCVLDVNAFVVTPTSESNDIQIKVENLSTEKVVGYRILNSQNNGNQYKIFTASTGDYGNGIWNLNDGLTFGSSSYDSIQKIWQENTEKYHYTFSETLLNEQTQYYKFDYYSPAYHWFTVNDSFWDVQHPPSNDDTNTVITDLYQLSFYADLTNFLTQPKFPAITSNLSNKNYVFQFTAKGNTAFSGEFNAGIVENKEDSPATALNFLASYRTTTLTGLENGYLKMASAATTPRELRIQNYVVTERGYFTKPLKIFNSTGGQLPILIGDNNTQSKYVIEGKEFLISTEYNDPDGDIDWYEITAYIDIVNDANKIKKWSFEADASGLISIRDKIGKLIDLTPNAPDRSVIVTVRLIDTNSNYYEIQTEKITLRQFPTDRSDIDFSIIQGSQRIGEYPKGRVTLRTIAPETIIGVNLQFQDMVFDTNNADYNITFYKDTDFTCNTFDCSFDYELDEYIFSANGLFRVDGWALVTTEEQTLHTPYNDILHDFKAFEVSWIAFSTARILQTIERTDKTYRNDEVIPLVVQLMDSTGLPRTLASKINVALQLEECSESTGGRCRNIDLNYSPNSIMFDETTGYTYFHFRQVFVEEDYTRLSDGNYFRVKAIIEDPTKTYGTLYIPVLADRCQDPDPLVWAANLLTMDFFGWGCNSGQFTDKIVALPDNNSHEEYLLIDEDHSVGAPTQFWWMCTSPDQNNLYSDILAQDILCFTWYLLGEQSIDEFKFYLTNNNTDLVITDDELKQYLEVSVPYEYIYFNDMQMMKAALEQEFNTDIDTVSDVILTQISHHLGAFAPTINIAGDYLTASGLIGNVGFEMGAVASGNVVDFNYATPIDPRVISGFLTYKIHNINVINKKDYETKYPELKAINAKNFTLWADMENVRLKSEPITIDVFVSDNVKILSIESNSKLIIDEVAKPNPINLANADENADIYFESLPTKITFRAISDLIYNNKLTFDRRYLILPYTLILSEETMCGWFGINCWGDDSSGTIAALIQEGDLSFFAVNAFGLFIMLGALLIGSVIYRNFRRRSEGG